MPSEVKDRYDWVTYFKIPLERRLDEAYEEKDSLVIQGQAVVAGLWVG